MDLEQKPSWSKGALRRLGQALVVDRAATPKGCPRYGDVMLWHNDLAAEVAARIANAPWSVPADQMSISARPKTIDTLIQKLQRQPTLKLGDVVDLAGVRVDADIVLKQQTELAQEIADYFDADRATIKDIRADPHSGYRAVHVWLYLPAGRVEVQIRTIHQSEWANLYEDLGEVWGRGIRYGETQENAQIQQMADRMQSASEGLAKLETFTDQIWQLERGIEAISPPTTPEHAELLERITPVYEEHVEAYTNTMAGLRTVTESFREVRRTIKERREA
jgi:ppGpp synthetase/RelA/SpoT-type nucleotidyltranferase